jgi:hypothetical protein
MMKSDCFVVCQRQMTTEKVNYQSVPFHRSHLSCSRWRSSIGMRIYILSWLCNCIFIREYVDNLQYRYRLLLVTSRDTIGWFIILPRRRLLFSRVLIFSRIDYCTHDVALVIVIDVRVHHARVCLGWSGSFLSLFDHYFLLQPQGRIRVNSWVGVVSLLYYNNGL